jgi:regulator of replication initiation timing
MMSESQNLSQSSIFSMDRLPEKRKSIEDMSSADWMQRVHRLKTHNMKLENDIERLQSQYDQVYTQKENIRKKAKELTEAVSGIYLKYDEMEKLLKIKDNDISRLTHRIENLETDLNLEKKKSIAVSHSTNGQGTTHHYPSSFPFNSPQHSSQFNASSSTSHHPHQHPHNVERNSFQHSAHKSHLFLSPSLSMTDLEGHSSEEKIEELSKIITEYKEREQSATEENSKLKARIAELEGTLTGTLLHSAYRNTPLRLRSTSSNPDMDPNSHSLLTTSSLSSTMSSNTGSNTAFPFPIPPSSLPGSATHSVVGSHPTTRDNVSKMVAALQAAALAPSSSSSSQPTSPFKVPKSNGKSLFSPEKKTSTDFEKSKVLSQETVVANADTDRLIFDNHNNETKENLEKPNSTEEKND